MVVSGKIKVIQEVEEKGTFKSRNVVVTTEEQYPQHIAIQFVQDKCSILDSYAVGQSVEVSINLRGKEWINPEGIAKYFNTIQGWKINKVGDATVAETAPVATDEPPF
jgi:membrane carboxypeptidase/penicillin-binding protein